MLQRNTLERFIKRQAITQKGFRGLHRIGLDEAGVQLRQVETKHMGLPESLHAIAMFKLDVDINRGPGRFRERHKIDRLLPPDGR
jgi:hypothetical protein